MALPPAYDIQIPAVQPTESPAQRLMKAAEHRTSTRRRVADCVGYHRDMEAGRVRMPLSGLFR
jgi:hypothetical protein